MPFRSVYCLDGLASDRDAECARYAGLLQRYPVDIVCMGIGENGHIAFNDPDVADFNDPKLVKVVALDPVCRQQQVNEKCFERLDLVPSEALTLTVPALLRGRWLFCIVPFASKAEAVRCTLYGEISEHCPAVCRNEADACLYLTARAPGCFPPNDEPVPKRKTTDHEKTDSHHRMPPRRGLHRTGPGVIRIGIIGLDTSHSTAFTELLNGTSGRSARP